MAAVGNSNIITRKYLDSLLIETRYMNSSVADQSICLWGERFDSPVMTAALSHLDHFMFEGGTDIYASAAVKTGTLLWIGMAGDDEVERCAAKGAKMIEIIKPYADRDLIYRKIRHAESLGLLAVGIDIDHPFADDGSLDVVDDFIMAPVTTEELRDLCASTSLPLIVKGVLSVYDANEAVKAGAAGLVLSHHNNRIEYALPPLAALPEIRSKLSRPIPLFVDGEIQTGLDVFKALALGATAVSIGRPLMTAIRNGQEAAMCEYLLKVRKELAKAMSYTGCTSLDKMDPAVIHYSSMIFPVNNLIKNITLSGV